MSFDVREIKVCLTEFNAIPTGQKVSHSIFRIKTCCEFTLSFYPKGFESSSTYAYLLLQYEGVVCNSMRVYFRFKATDVTNPIACNGFKTFTPIDRSLSVALFSTKGRKYSLSDKVEFDITFEYRSNAKADLQSTNEELWSNVQSSNFTVSSNGQSIPVHKHILESRSPVLKTMLQSGMFESTSNELMIPLGHSTKTIKVFLYFLYTSHLSAMKKPERVWELLQLAHMYGVEELQLRCELLLESQVTVINCYTLLANAELMNCENLKKYIVRFLLRNRLEHPKYTEKLFNK